MKIYKLNKSTLGEYFAKIASDIERYDAEQMVKDALQNHFEMIDQYFKKLN